MNFDEIREKAIDSELLTITSGRIEAKTRTYTQNSNDNNRNLACVINAYYFEHPEHGGIMIDSGFSSDFYQTPPYGNLNIIMKLFLKLKGGKYIQSKNTDTAFQLREHGVKPDHIYLSHRHPDHTSAISQLPEHVSDCYGKGENSIYYWLLTRKHFKGKRKQLIDFENGVSFESFDRLIDIFGDHSFLALSTKGHTKDHISYLVNGKKGEKDARESAEKIRAFSSKHPEVEVCYSHDL